MAAQDGRARAGLLLLADGRFPAGAYAHSGTLEPIIASGGVRTVADLELFLEGRLRTTGLVAASFAAAACGALAEEAADGAGLRDLDAELDARTPSPAQRETSRQLGRQLVRAMMSIAPDTRLSRLGRTPHQPIALGATYAVLALEPHDAALACLYDAAATPVTAAVRLLSVDPFDTHALLARLMPLIDELAERAVAASIRLEDLPASTGPLLDTNAERHRSQTSRLFAS